MPGRRMLKFWIDERITKWLRKSLFYFYNDFFFKHELFIFGANRPTGHGLIGPISKPAIWDRDPFDL